jgi:hypothetical protein
LGIQNSISLLIKLNLYKELQKLPTTLSFMKIFDRIKYVSSIAFDFDFENYLLSQEKLLFIIEIDTINRRYKARESDIPLALLEAFNSRYRDAKAGYLVDVSSEFSTDLKCDLISLSDIVLNSNPIDLDTIIIHELTHCLLDSNHAEKISPYGDCEDDASRLFSQTDEDFRHQTRHTQEFCNLICRGCHRYTHKTANFGSGWLAARSAMRYDAFFDE